MVQAEQERSRIKTNAPGPRSSTRFLVHEALEQETQPRLPRYLADASPKQLLSTTASNCFCLLAVLNTHGEPCTNNTDCICRHPQPKVVLTLQILKTCPACHSTVVDIRRTLLLSSQSGFNIWIPRLVRFLPRLENQWGLLLSRCIDVAGHCNVLREGEHALAEM
jgi:hypothetical protein